MSKMFSRMNLQLFSEDLEGGAPVSNPEDVIPAEEEDIIPGEDVTPEENLENTDLPEPEEELIPKSQVSKIVSDRVNQLNKKYEKFDRYESTMQQLIQLSGLTEEQFFAQLEQVELQQSAQQMGVSPEVAKQMMDSQRALEEAKRTTLDMKYQMEEQSLINNPLYSGYDEVKDEVRKMADNSGLTLEQSYWALHGASLIDKQTKLAEHRVNHNINHKQKRASVEVDGNTKTPNTPGSVLNDTQRQMAENLGLSADEYALYNNDDLTYDQIVEMKKKKQGGK